MNFLCVETSTPRCVAVLSRREHPLLSESALLERGRGEAVSAMAGRLLKKGRCEYRDLDVFGVGVGPGSFTGLRIGVSWTKGCAFATQRPCVGVSSLDVIARGATPPCFGRFAVAVDARRGHVYYRIYETKKDGVVVGRGVVRKVSVKDFIDAARGSAWITGDAIKAYRAVFERSLKDTVLADEPAWYPTPAGLASCVEEACRKKRFVSVEALNITYLYEADCQVRRI
jgi:tRNA threonylcarbamoyladenosine biosynthesis protein TsaB